MKKGKRTIESILDLKTGKEIKAEEFFAQPINVIFKYRAIMEEHIQKNQKRYVCYYCKQNIKIKGKIENSKKILHFAHLKDSDECPIKTDTKLTKKEIEQIKYNGVKESELHIYLKNKIASCLLNNQKTKGEVSEIRIEEVKKGKVTPKKWKKPDVSAKFKDRDIVFELQLSTTFLSTIVERQEFYRENQTYILWIFNHFEEDEERRKFTQSDVFYSNNRNGFEFDKKAQELSEKQNDLILNCHYEKPVITENIYGFWEIEYIWKQEYVSLSQLTFDENYKVYYYNVEAEEKNLQEKIEILNSPFLNLIKAKDFQGLLELFKRKNISEKEYKYLKKLYKENIEPTKHIIEKNSEEFMVIWAIILRKIKKENLIEEIAKDEALRKVITHLLSLKTGKIIGYSFKKQVQIAHLSLQYYPEYKNYYLRGIKKWTAKLINKGVGEWRIINYEKEKKLQDKVKKIENKNIKPKKSKIIELIFPELKLN